jgi:Na+-transporting methylmalonyl-CoA/oxaloacetate decarboxylase beta subunit
MIFAIVVMAFCLLVIPAAAPLISMLFIGNFLRENGVTERLVKAAQNEIINIVTIFLGLTVGLKMGYDQFLDPKTLGILALGVIAFVIATASGVLMAKLMNLFSKNKINPLIGSAGVSAVPMAARVSQVEGQKADPGKLPPHARDGTQRGRRHRQRPRRRLLHRPPGWLIRQPYPKVQLAVDSRAALLLWCRIC